MIIVVVSLEEISPFIFVVRTNFISSSRGTDPEILNDKMSGIINELLASIESRAAELTLIVIYWLGEVNSKVRLCAVASPLFLNSG